MGRPSSIVIVTILYTNDIIDSSIYSILIASSMIFTFIVPILFSNLLAIKNKKESKNPLTI